MITKLQLGIKILLSNWIRLNEELLLLNLKNPKFFIKQKQKKALKTLKKVITSQQIFNFDTPLNQHHNGKKLVVSKQKSRQSYKIFIDLRKTFCKLWLKNLMKLLFIEFFLVKLWLKKPLIKTDWLSSLSQQKTIQKHQYIKN